MANYLADLWSNNRETQSKNQAFIGYRGKSKTAAKSGFSSWLLGFPTSWAINANNTQTIFGTRHFSPIDVLMQNSSRGNIDNFGDRDKGMQHVLEHLKKIVANCEHDERSFYMDVGAPVSSDLEACFQWFKQTYWNRQYDKNSSEEKKDYWFEKHISFLEGKYQRLIATTGSFTQFQQMMNLISIELEDANFGTYTGKQVGPIRGEQNSHIKEIIENWLAPLSEDGVFQRAGITSKSGKAKEILIPRSSEHYVDEALLGAALQVMEEQIASSIPQTQKNIADITAGAIQRIMTKMEIPLTNSQNSGFDFRFTWKPGDKRTTETGKRISSGQGVSRRMEKAFVYLRFRQQDGKSVLEENARIKLIVDSIMKYFAAVRNYALTDKELQEWRADNQKGGSLTNSLRRRLTTLVTIMEKGGRGVSLPNANDLNSLRPIMGYFGELAALARSYYRFGKGAGKKDVVIENLGAFTGKTGKEAASDLVLIAKSGKRYGFQVKNPYDISNIDGYYDVAKDSYKLSLGQEADYLYKNILQLTDQQIVAFQTLVLNVYNADSGISPSDIIDEINFFLMIHAGGFGRYRMMNEDSQDKQYDAFFEDKEKVNNIFFIIRGELYPCSKIAKAMCAQWEEFMKKIAASPISIEIPEIIKKADQEMRISKSAKSTLEYSSKTKKKKGYVPILNLTYEQFLKNGGTYANKFENVNNQVNSMLRQVKIASNIKVKINPLATFITKI